MRISAVVLAVAVAVSASACVNLPRYEWVNSRGNSTNTQFAADQGQCTALAYQAVPPSSPIPTQQQRQSAPGISTFAGSTNTGTTFSGEVITFNQGQSGSASQAYANSQQQWQAIGAKNQEANARQQIFAGCMVQLGWTLQQSSPAASTKSVPAWDARSAEGMTCTYASDCAGSLVCRSGRCVRN